MNWKSKTYHLRVVKDGKVVNLDDKGRPIEQPKALKKPQELSAKSERPPKRHKPKGPARTPKEQQKFLVKQDKKRKKILKHFGRKLNKKLPKSEQWFMEEYSKHTVPSDKFNEPAFNTIPDIINRKYKYVVEVDDPSHDNPETQEKDRKKDELRRSCGYAVFRVVAYNEQSRKEVIEKLLAIHAQPPVKIDPIPAGTPRPPSSPKFIIRKK